MYTELSLYLACVYFSYVSYSTLNYKHTALPISYRQVNCVKAVALGSISPLTFSIIYNILFYHYLNYYLIALCGATYAALDMSSLLYCTNLHMSTTVHHWVVQFLYFYGVYFSWDINTFVAPIVLYASFSSLSYLVNYRLSIRGLNRKYEKDINAASLVIYSGFSVCNWVIQFYYVLFVLNQWVLYKLFYLTIVCLIVYDDYFLMSFLYRSLSPIRFSLYGI